MNKSFPTPRRRSLKAFTAGLISYLLLVGPLAPLALAARPHAPRAGVASPAPESGRRAAPLAAAPAPLAFAPNIVATKVDSFNDLGADGKADPGQTITYTVTITNNGPDPATGVTFTDMVDANTSLVPGSVQTQPVAVADAFNVIGNVRIQVPDGASDLLANDRDPDTGNNTGLTASGPTTSTNNGNVTVNADGSFSYNPAPGFTGTDTFTYTITDSGGAMDTGTVTLTVSGLVWFINSAAAVGGDGRLTSPFNCYVGANVPASTTCYSATAVDDPGDNIFLYSGSYTGGDTLQNNQKLIGQGATTTLDAVAGVTVPANSDPLPALNGNPSTVTITTTAASTNGVNLAAGAANVFTLRGFTVGNTTGIDIASGANFGTLNVSEVTLSGTGRPLSLTSGALAATFNSITATAAPGGQGINLAGLTGTMAVTGGTSITNPGTQCILVGTTTASINFGNTTCSGGTDGVSLQNNSSGTRTFGTLSVSNNSGAGFLHTGGGGTTVVGATTITNPGTNGVSVAGSTTSVSFGNTSITGSGAAGVLYTGSSGNLSFADLDITPDNNVQAISTNGNAGTLSATSGAIATSGAAALNLNSTVLNLVFDSVSAATNGSANNAINIVGGSGAVSAPAGTITGGTNPAVIVNGGSVSLAYGGGISQSNNAALLSVLGGHTGTLTFQTGTLSATGGTGLQFDNADGAYNFNGTTTLAGGDAGVDILNDSGGAFNFSAATTITSPSGTAFNVNTGAPNVDYNGTITQNTSGQRVVNVDGTTGSTVLFDGTVTGGQNSTGVRINNANGNVTFTATLTLGTSVARMGSQAVTIAGGSGAKTFGVVSIFTTGASGIGIGATTSTGAITTASGTVDSAGAAAVNIAGTSAASRTPLNVQLTTVNTNAGTNGIILQNTSATGSPGGFRILGTSAGICGGQVTNTTTPSVAATVTAANTADCTGGTITGATGDGIRLNNADRVSLTRVRVINGAQSGIFGTGVNGFELISSFISNNGNAADEVGLKFTDVINPGTVNGLVGTALNGANPTRIINSTVRQSGEFNVEVVNRTGTLTDLFVDGCQFTDTKSNAGPADADGFNVEMQNTAVATVRLQNSVFSNNFTQGAQLSAIDSANLTATVTSSTFANNFEGFVCNHSGNSDLVCTVGGDVGTQGNHFEGNPSLAESGALVVLSNGSSATVSASLTGKVKNNHVTAPANMVNHSILAFISGVGTPSSLNISNNTVNGGAFGNPILVDTPDTGSSPNFSVTANNNVLSGGSSHGVNVTARQSSTSCVLIQNNTGTPPGASAVVRVRQVSPATYNLKQGVSASLVPATVLTDNNPGASNSVAGTINVVSNAACTTPIASLLGVPNRTFSEVASRQTPAATANVTARDSGGTREREALSARASAIDAPASGVSAGGFARADSPAFSDGWADTFLPARTASINGLFASALRYSPSNVAGPLASAYLASPAATAAFSGETVGPINIGTLPATKSVTIKFRVTVDSTVTATNISNQGTVSGTNFSPVQTDDPDAAGSANPTLTPVDLPDVTVAVSPASALEDGADNLVYTFARQGATTSSLTVNFSVGGTATFSTDYTQTGAATFTPPTGTVVIASGSSTATVTVDPSADSTVEPDETVILTVTSGTAYDVGSPSVATGTITNDDTDV
ncbi:MAG TPA: Ig-like domain-containing protein, partial [Pyrinomonadaceae bacterium]